MQSYNQRSKRALQLAAVLGLMACFGLAHAQVAGSGLYVGGNLGKPRYTDSIAGVGTGGDSVAGKIYGGYSLTPNFGVEANLVDLGRVDGAAGRVKGYGGSIDAVGLLPLSTQLSLLGRVGAGYMRMEAPTGRDSGAALKLGAGAQYSLSPNVALRGEWERYRIDAFGSKPNVDQYTLGVNYRF
jgi:OmpA-OmpF porin, OOP family